MKKEKILFTTEIDYNLVKNDLEYFLEDYNLPENLTFKEVKENHREDMQDFIDTYIEDSFTNLKYNLEILSRELPNSVVEMADLGLWNGRYYGIREIELEDIMYDKDYGIREIELEDIMYDKDYFILYLNKDLELKNHHHDGTNYFTFRVFRSHITSEQKENFIVKYEEGKLTKSTINYYTESLKKYIEKVWGI